ncbi:hypothetical protein SUGI_0074530 [Cryptomeria japonica]|uniref:uncharacterized protein LOC131029148 n=1 Tax=Cryptomeria japonica TaxID=3369 RepID=UPI002408C6D3|nr:uncharacterized protein LOC131029148 [Cryptomeria japonica]GLJ07811.1 hypothetical protein SUGI_0074530 [Cryptomeria japonica]
MATNILIYVILVFSCVRNNGDGSQITCTETLIVLTDQNTTAKCNRFLVLSSSVKTNEVSASFGFPTYPVLVRNGVEWKTYIDLDKRGQSHGLLLNVAIFLFKQIVCLRMLLHMYLFIIMVAPKSKSTV